MRLYILLLAISVSCSNKRESKNETHFIIDSTSLAIIEEKGESLVHDLETVNKNNNIGNDSSFYEFLDEFKVDSLFQISRIDFPFHIIVWDMEDNVDLVTIEKSDWKYLDLTYDSAYYYRKIDAYKMLIEVTTDSAIVEYKGINNGIYFYYIFYNRSEKWFLNRLEDLST